MVSKSDLPELDDPGTVSQLGAKFVAIGMLNKSIIDEAKYGWTDIATSYQAPESGKVQRAFHTPSEAADELERRTKKVGDALDSYSNTLSDLHTEKAQIESDIDAANAKYAEAMAMPEKVEEPDPDNPGETIEKDNEEREQALAEANQMIAAAEAAVQVFKFKVQQEDRSLADSIGAETINPNTGEAAWSNFAGGSLFKGIFDGIIGMPKFIVGTVRLNVSDVWNHRHDLKNFFFGPDGARHRQFWLQAGTLLAPPGMGGVLGTFGATQAAAPAIAKGAQDGSLKQGALTAVKWVNENLQDAVMGPAAPSVYIHGEAWLRKWGTETAHDPAYTIGGLAPTVVTGGLSVELKAGSVVAKKLTKPGEKAVKKGLDDAVKKAYEDPMRDAFNNGIYDSVKEAYGSQGEQGAAPSAPAPAPAPAEQPAPAPAPAAPAPAPAPVAPAPAPAPVAPAPAPAPVAPAPAPAPVAPAPAPVDQPAPAPVAPAPAPAPAPVDQPAPAPAPRPADPVSDALETLGNAATHDFFEFRNDLIDQISAIDGIDGDAVRAFADDPEGFAQRQANQAYEDFLSANPEVKQLVP